MNLFLTPSTFAIFSIAIISSYCFFNRYPRGSKINFESHNHTTISTTITMTSHHQYISILIAILLVHRFFPINANNWFYCDLVFYFNVIWVFQAPGPSPSLHVALHMESHSQGPGRPSGHAAYTQQGLPAILVEVWHPRNAQVD